MFICSKKGETISSLPKQYLGGRGANKEYYGIFRSGLLCCVSFSHNASQRKHERMRMRKHEEREFFFSLPLCLCLRQRRFHCEISYMNILFSFIMFTTAVLSL